MVLDAEADGELLACGEVLVDGLIGSESGAGVDLRALLSNRKGALGFELFRSAKAAVGFALGKQALGVLGIDMQPLGLAVGAVVAGCAGHR